MNTSLTRVAFVAALTVTSASANAVALNPGTVTPIALTAAAYTQNFNTLASSGTSSALPAGFQTFEGGATNGNATYVASTGSDNSGTVYSFGAAGSTERALGSVASGSNNPIFFGAFFTNALTTAINSLTIAYTGEQWRNGVGATDSLTFQYSLNATAVNNGSWTAVSGLSYTSLTSTGAALNGNAAANRIALDEVVSGLSIAGGATFGVRWVDGPVGSGSQDGLAVDDFSLTAGFAPAAVIPEPATWAVMLLGFGFVGIALRRRPAAAAA